MMPKRPVLNMRIG